MCHLMVIFTTMTFQICQTSSRAGSDLTVDLSSPIYFIPPRTNQPAPIALWKYSPCGLWHFQMVPGWAPPVLLRLDGLFFIVLFNLSKFPSILYGPLSAISRNHIVEHQWTELNYKEKCKLYIFKVEMSPANIIMDSQRLPLSQKWKMLCVYYCTNDS